MKLIKIYSTIILFFSFTVNSQTTINGSFMFGGENRTYSFYVPASYNSASPVPLVLNLHGYTSNGQEQRVYANFMPIADTANFIVVHPDGTINSFTNERFWNFNILGATVNDVGFLEALIDTISANYSINSDRVYSVGMSNGGYMSYYLACQSNRFAAVGSVTGAMSIGMYNNCNTSNPTPAIQVHGTADNVVPYAGNLTSKPIVDVVNFWVNNNGCNTTPVVMNIPDINTSDGATAERIVYSGGINGNTVEFFKVTGGGHTWPGALPLPLNGNTCMDFSASKEVWRFFSQYQHVSTLSLTDNEKSTVSIWPNPSTGIFNFQSLNNNFDEVLVLDMMGREVDSKKGNNILDIDLSNLDKGNYLLYLKNKGNQIVKNISIH